MLRCKIDYHWNWMCNVQLNVDMLLKSPDFFLFCVKVSEIIFMMFASYFKSALLYAGHQAFCVSILIEMQCLHVL